jgi:hypothetical protein
MAYQAIRQVLHLLRNGTSGAAAWPVRLRDCHGLVRVSRQTVVTLRSGYAKRGLDVLVDMPRSGRPSTVDEAIVVVTTLNPPPAILAVTHWSARLLSAHLSKAGTPVSFAEIARIWRDWGLQRTGWRRSSSLPTRSWRPRSATWSGCILIRPPTRWWSASMRSPRSKRWTAPHPCYRCGSIGPSGAPTTTYATAPPRCSPRSIATGKITADACYPRHRNGEFLAFLKLVANAHPRVPLHVVCDNYATHNHPAVKAWLARNPHITLHFTPTSV